MTDFLKGYPPPPPPNADALAKIKAAVDVELAKKAPVRSWQREALMLWGAPFGVFVIVAVGLLISGALREGALASRLLTVLPLLAAAALCAFAALAPRRPGVRLVAVSAAVSSALLLVVARSGITAVSAVPEWVCTALHLASAIVPVLVAVLMLRGVAPSPLRAAVAGLAMGTTGAMLGELACGQGLRHVAVFHLGAWALVVLACIGFSRVVVPRSYAP